VSSHVYFNPINTLYLEKVNSMEKDVLTVQEVATYLRVTPDTVYRLARQEKLPSFKVGRHIRFRREAIEAYMSQESEPVLEQEKVAS
jgi:excisionase family DNA binding protein